jgi:hypothetical protein
MPGVTSTTANEETAASAWLLVQQLHASDEKTKIKDPTGRIISWQELRDRARRAVD